MFGLGKETEELDVRVRQVSNKISSFTKLKECVRNYEGKKTQYTLPTLVQPDGQVFFSGD